MSALDKFLKYVSFDTQSDPERETVPSTAKQLVLARVLEQELKDLGLSDVKLADTGVVYATLPATQGRENDVQIGLISHMDTAGEMSGKDVRPRIIKNYDGGVIELNEEFSMSPERFGELNKVIGDDLVVTDGTTLLGGDDKAGIAIIMESLEKMIKEGRPHGTVWVAFTPDEEIGKGVEHFDYGHFKADFAYTVDGGDIEYVEYETFNAALADVTFTGRSIHPGSAKGRMINAAAAAVQFASVLPQWQRPEFTEGYEGFLHLLHMEGECEKAHLQYLIRDHDRTLFEKKKEILRNAQALVNSLYEGCCHLEIHDQYYNLKDYMNGDMHSVERAKKALREAGLEPRSNPIRGGTDGAVLSQNGLITPNLGTGMANCHGRYEFVSVNKMEQMSDIVCDILEG